MVVTFCGMILLDNIKASAFLVFRGNGFIQLPEQAGHKYFIAYQVILILCLIQYLQIESILRLRSRSSMIQSGIEKHFVLQLSNSGFIMD